MIFTPIEGSRWAVSKVNSDVPGGFAEASMWPPVAMEAINNFTYSYINFGEILINKLCNIL